MNLSPKCQEVYERWIGNDTWHTGHPGDKERFYNFVDAFIQYPRGKKKIGGDDLERDIITRYEAKYDDSKVLEERAEHYSVLFWDIVEFIRVTKR